MLISEKQIMQLIDIARAYISITHNDENEEIARILLTDIKNQQSDQLQEVKCEIKSQE